MEIQDRMKYSPMIRQYLQMKDNYPDTILFYRVGDFYEMFFDDALVASRELEIVLTGKDAGVENRIPMCGVPHHAKDQYITRLAQKGYKVAVIEQVENPNEAKGIVRREVVDIITPGTQMDDGLVETENNYIVCLQIDNQVKENEYILAYCDLSTGENYLTRLPYQNDILYSELLKLKSKEIVVDSAFPKNILTPLSNVSNFIVSIEDDSEAISYLKYLTEALDQKEARCFNRLINYIIRLKKKTLVHLRKVEKYDVKGYMHLDTNSRRNLEVVETIRFQTKKNTLFSVLDKCQTAMGTRYLKRQLTYPLVDRQKIEKRYDVIDRLKAKFVECEEIKNLLTDVYDLERIVGKISYESCNPKDLLQLKRSLAILPELKELVIKVEIDDVFDLKTNYDKLMSIHKLIEDSISVDCPFTLKEGGVIKSGFNPDLDDLRQMNSGSKDYLVNLERKERERTGIKTLKVGFNKVFGYYLEVTKSMTGLVKDEFGYIRKQTLANCERYITQELKEKEALILRAEEKILELETKIFTDIRNTIKTFSLELQQLARIISEIDMMQSFTYVAKVNGYVRCKITDEREIKIIDGRHPVVEINNKEGFIPNNIIMPTDTNILLITGPNMSGKSTYMRQLALISIMAQVGSFVPCKSCTIPIFDSIYTRIGASDDLVSGQSTFMVEMNEVNNAIKGTTDNSLILFDEIGRGTATYDGMALAQAIIEYIHENRKCKTIFSTHYHELTSLDESLPHLENYFVSCEEINGEVVFMHKVKKGKADKSYGINVAKLANLPIEIITRATDILSKLQIDSKYDNSKLSIDNYYQPLFIDSKTDQETYVLQEIKNKNLYELNPLDCMNLLNDLQKKLK